MTPHDKWTSTDIAAHTRCLASRSAAMMTENDMQRITPSQPSKEVQRQEDGQSRGDWLGWIILATVAFYGLCGLAWWLL